MTFEIQPNALSRVGQAQQAILSSPMVADEDRSSPLRETSTPIRRHISPSSFRVELTPVSRGSRPSGLGGSPTECLRDYLSGLQGGGREDRSVSAFGVHLVSGD